MRHDEQKLQCAKYHTVSLYEDLVCIYPFHLINIRVCPLCAHAANGNITSHLTLSTQEENQARKCVTAVDDPFARY
jgi:hypothetical protein